MNKESYAEKNDLRNTSENESENVSPDDLIPRGRKDRPTKVEIQKRLDFMCGLLRRRLYKSDIQHVFRQRFARNGKQISWRSCERYMAHARRLLQEEHARKLGMEPEDLKRERFFMSEDFWNEIVSGPGANLRDRMAAQERLEWLWGIRAGEPDSEDTCGAEGLNLIEVVVRSRVEASEVLKLTPPPPPPNE